MRKRDHAAPRRHRPTSKSVKYSVHVRWLKFNQIIRHSFTTIVSVLALIAGAPIHPAIRLEPHGLLFFFFLFLFLLSLITQRRDFLTNLLLKRHESDSCDPNLLCSRNKVKSTAVSPTIPVFHGLPQGTRHIYTTGRYDPRQLSGI